MHDLLMRRYLATAPPWVLVVTQAVFVVGWMTVWNVGTERDGWTRSFRGALIGAAVIGVSTWFGNRRATSKTAWILGDLSREQQSAVRRAAAEGVPPDDPALRRAALELAQFQLTEFMARRMTGILVLCFLIAGSVGFAINDRSLWFVVGAAIFGASLISLLRYPARQRRRLARLEDASGE